MGVQVEYISQVGGCTSKMNEGSKDWKIYIVDAKVQRCNGAIYVAVEGGSQQDEEGMGWDGMEDRAQTVEIRDEGKRRMMVYDSIREEKYRDMERTEER